MSAADAAWLRMDRPQNLMVINGVLSQTIVDAFTHELAALSDPQEGRDGDPPPVS